MCSCSSVEAIVCFTSYVCVRACLCTREPINQRGGEKKKVAKVQQHNRSERIDSFRLLRLCLCACVCVCFTVCSTVSCQFRAKGACCQLHGGTHKIGFEKQRGSLARRVVQNRRAHVHRKRHIGRRTYNRANRKRQYLIPIIGVAPHWSRSNGTTVQRW